LIEKCLVPDEIDVNSWSVNCLSSENKRISEKFQEDLMKFGQNIPPSFGRFPTWTDVIRKMNLIQFNLVVLRLNLVKNILAGKWDYIIEREADINTGLEIDPEFMDIHVITLIIETLLKNKHSKALSFGLKIGQILCDQSRFDFSSLGFLMGILIFPTVFDSQEWLPAQEISVSEDMSKKVASYLDKVAPYKMKFDTGRRRTIVPVAAENKSPEETDKYLARTNSLNPYVSDSKRILPMISLEMLIILNYRRLQKVFDGKQSDLDEDIIRVMQNVLTDGLAQTKKAGMSGITLIPHEKTISARANLAYIYALLNSKKYDEYFGVCIEVIMLSVGKDCAQHVLKGMDIYGLNYTKDYLDSVLTSVNSILKSKESSVPMVEKTAISNVLKMKNALTTIIRIAAHMMDGLEISKSEKEYCLLYSRILIALTGILTYTPF
jgi:hypothetical protein